MTGFEWAPCELALWQGESVKLLSLAAQGAYWQILLLQFREGSVPSDPKKLARLIGCDSSDLNEIWPEIKEKFVEFEPGRLQNARMADIREEQLEKAATVSEKGRKAASRRWGNPISPTEPTPLKVVTGDVTAAENAHAMPMQCTGNAQASDSENAHAMHGQCQANATRLDKTKQDIENTKTPLVGGCKGEEVKSPGEKSVKPKSWEVRLFDLLPPSHQTAEMKLALTKYGRLRSQKGWGGYAQVTLETKAAKWATSQLSDVLDALAKATEQGWQSVNVHPSGASGGKQTSFRTAGEEKAAVMALFLAKQENAS